MTEARALDALLLLIAAVGVVVTMVSSAAFGRILTDLEYQQGAKLNGVHRIQAWVNLRMHGNRIALGLYGLVLGAVLLFAVIADGAKSSVTPRWQTWVLLGLFGLLLLSYAASAIADWMDERRQVRILLSQRQAAEPSDLEGC